MPRYLTVAIAFFAAMASIAVSPASSLAGGGQTITVTRDDDPAPNGCKPDDCSLREAIIDANATSAADMIIVPAMHIKLTQTTNSSAGDVHAEGVPTGLVITDDVTIAGAGVGQTIIDGNRKGLVFDVPTSNFPTPADTNVLLHNLTVTGGSDGGIYNNGNLTLDRTVVSDNDSGTDNDGGGIVSGPGLLTITDSTITDNHADLTGGGIEAGDVIIKNSLVAGNTSGEGGSGVSAGGLQMTNTTVTNNRASGNFGGGGVVVSTFLTNLPPSSIVNSTITDNESSDSGGGVLAYNGSPLTIKNSILWGNSALSGPECSGTITGDENVVKSKAGCTLSGTTISADPLLFPLGDHGGPTESIGIPKESPARDAGGAAVCPDTDQRGIPRPQPVSCDIGAFEFMFLGDVDCSGTVAVPDLLAELGSIGGVAGPACLYRGDMDCDDAIAGLDGLYILRHIAQLPEQPRPLYCPDIGPDTPLT